MSDILDQCRDLAVSLAPELSQRPLYVLDSRELPWLTNLQCRGFALSHVDENVREHLGDRWMGPGPAIVLDLAAITADGLDPLGIMLHETAHVLPAREPLDLSFIGTQHVAAFQRAKLTEFVAETSPDLDGHDAGFVRRTCHLFIRAALAGYQIDPYSLWNSGSGLSQPAHYVCSLLAEAVRLRDATFAEIEATEPPPAFARLFTNDPWRVHSYGN